LTQYLGLRYASDACLDGGLVAAIGSGQAVAKIVLEEQLIVLILRPAALWASLKVHVARASTCRPRP
jgi:hypothetical protein